MSACPPEKSLERLATVTMSETDFVALERHIQQCVNCQAVLERLARDGSQRPDDASTRPSEPEEVPLLPGFVVEHELGRGSMGVVYQAWQLSLTRHVAIKFLKRGAAASREARERWLKEAQALSRVRTRGIVQIFEIGDAEGWLYLVLELMRGGSLKDRLAKPLPPRTAARVAEQVASTVEEIHRAGLLHLDLKPSNILLDGPANGSWDQMTPMIGDFGIARPQDDSAFAAGRASGVWGTPSYMAPEQASLDRGDIGRPADIYAVGATLYHLLTGRPPFLAATASETLEQVRRGEVVSPRELVPSVPRDLETICIKSLQKAPKDRYASAAALADDLRRFLEGKPVKARPLGPIGRASRWCLRNPGTASLAAVLCLALVGGIAGITLQWRRAEAARERALASDAEAEQVLNDLLQSAAIVPVLGYRPAAPSIESLLKAEAHCKSLLQKNPGQIPLRIALTRVYGWLGTLFAQQGQRADAETVFQRAQDLWEPLASQASADPTALDWIATTFSWHIDDDSPRYFQCLQRANAIWQKLDDEQPDSPALLQKLWDCQVHMLSVANRSWARGEVRHLLDQSRLELEQRAARPPRGSGREKATRARLLPARRNLGQGAAGRKIAVALARSLRALQRLGGGQPRRSLEQSVAGNYRRAADRRSGDRSLLRSGRSAVGAIRSKVGGARAARSPSRLAARIAAARLLLFGVVPREGGPIAKGRTSRQ